MMKVTGLKEIDTVLRGLPLQLTDRLLQNAAARAAKPLVVKEQLLAPEGPEGALVDSIGVVKERYGSGREIGQVAVGPRRRGRYKGYHAHLVEYGTKERFNRRGASRGRMPAKPFAKPAFDATKDQVLGNYRLEVGRVVYNYMRRVLR